MSKRVRLMIDFQGVDALKAWVAASLKDGTLPADSAVYEMDGLDDKVASGVTKSHTYIVRREGDRPSQFRLKV